jgi:vacuolar-type H+-ATPase subunit B/Vma2
MVWLVLLLVTDVVCADKRAEREIRAGYDRIVQYTKQKNVEGLLRMMTPDFMYRTRRGMVMSKQMVEMAMREHYARIQSVKKRTTSIRKMEFQGKTVRVTTAEEFVAIILDPLGQPHEHVNRATTRDTWVKTPQGWKIKMTEILEEETFIDGRRQTG